MAQKHFTCPSCRKKTPVAEPTYGEIVERAGEASAITFLATIATLPIGGVGGLVSGIYYSGKGIYNFASIDCAHCGIRFPIARWTDGD